MGFKASINHSLFSLVCLCSGTKPGQVYTVEFFCLEIDFTTTGEINPMFRIGSFFPQTLKSRLVQLQYYSHKSVLHSWLLDCCKRASQYKFIGINKRNIHLAINHLYCSLLAVALHQID